MEKIDNLDRQILEIIMRNARIPSKDVAAECGVSRAAIHQRIQRMIDMHVITGSGYHVNPKSLGFRTCTYIGVKLEKGSMYRDVVPELEKIPEVVECHFTTGPYTMLCKLYARDNEHLMELLNDTSNSTRHASATCSINNDQLKFLSDGTKEENRRQPDRTETKKTPDHT